MPGKVTFKLTTTANPPVEAFLQVLQDTYDILRDIDAAVSAKPQGTILWRVSDLRVSSALATLDAEPTTDDLDVGQEVAKAYVRGLDLIENSPTIPPFFSEETLEKAKRLVGVLRGDVTRITVTVPGVQPVHLTQRVAANVDEIIGPQYESYGSIEGILETISVHGRPHFTIYEVLSHKGVRCFLPQGMMQKAYEAFPKRVAVSGKIKYTRRGHPVSINVDDLRVLRESKDLPQAKDLEGIDLTSGQEPSEYIRRLRRAK